MYRPRTVAGDEGDKLQVRILGTFEVVRDGVLITPSAPKPRRTLALLAVCGNSVVRADQIIEELWEDRPPLSATTTLHTYVYQLRKLLHPGRDNSARDSRTVLRRCPGGYLLSLPPDALDSSRFELLADRGRSERDAGSMEAAANTLRQALQHWRGPALHDIGVGPILQAEAVRLQEAQKAVLEQRIDVDLALGRHQELIGELSGVVAGQPTHESFWAKLMLALYRSGRRSDALHSFQRARNALAGELGLEPSDELQCLHRSILSADPKLAGPRRSIPLQVRPTPAADRPDQLPAPEAFFVGRESEQQALLQALGWPHRDAPAIAALVGAPGSGKTALAIRVARQLRDAHPDGALYAALADDGSPAGAGEVLGGFLTALGTPSDRMPESLEARVRAYRTLTLDRKVIVVLDDVTRREQLLPLLPSGSGCSVVVVLRRRIAQASVGTTVCIAPMPTDHGMQLLTRVLDIEPTGPDGLALHELVELCGGLPMVLRSAATRMVMRPHWGAPFLVDRVREQPRLLVDNLDEASTLARSVARSRGALSYDADVAFGRLASMSTQSSFSIDAAARALHLETARAETLLEEMVEFQLADVQTAAHPSGGHFRYALPRLLRLAASARAADLAPTASAHAG